MSNFWIEVYWRQGGWGGGRSEGRNQSTVCLSSNRLKRIPQSAMLLRMTLHIVPQKHFTFLIVPRKHHSAPRHCALLCIGQWTHHNVHWGCVFLVSSFWRVSLFSPMLERGGVGARDAYERIWKQLYICIHWVALFNDHVVDIWSGYCGPVASPDRDMGWVKISKTCLDA